jgi:CheY-like chemotaxis protein
MQPVALATGCMFSLLAIELQMSKRVLDVGQCDPDHGTICRYLTREFAGVEIQRTSLPAETLAALRNTPFDLVLINRKLDEDYSDGLEILQTIKADPAIANVPVMLVTNYAEHQQASVAAGGEYGFGKLEFDKPETRERLAKFLE